MTPNAVRLESLSYRADRVSAAVSFLTKAWSEDARRRSIEVRRMRALSEALGWRRLLGRQAKDTVFQSTSDDFLHIYDNGYWAHERLGKNPIGRLRFDFPAEGEGFESLKQYLPVAA